MMGEYFSKGTMADFINGTLDCFYFLFNQKYTRLVR